MLYTVWNLFPAFRLLLNNVVCWKMETYPENKLMEVFEQAKQGLALPELKEEQKKIILNIVKGNNCVGVLPTGFGKSVCFYLPPVVLNLVRNIFRFKHISIKHIYMENFP